eukprot:747615-Hanusia_phi.AAC.3
MSYDKEKLRFSVRIVPCSMTITLTDEEEPTEDEIVETLSSQQLTARPRYRLNQNDHQSSAQGRALHVALGFHVHEGASETLVEYPDATTPEVHLTAEEDGTFSCSFDRQQYMLPLNDPSCSDICVALLVRDGEEAGGGKGGAEVVAASSIHVSHMAKKPELFFFRDFLDRFADAFHAVMRGADEEYADRGLLTELQVREGWGNGDGRGWRKGW